MLRFLKFIRIRLINEGNVTRYLLYAFGEIILLVIGILIALSPQYSTYRELESTG